MKKIIFSFLISISLIFYGTTLVINKKILKKGINAKSISKIVKEWENNHDIILVTDDRYYFYLKANIDTRIEIFPQHNLYDFAPKKINFENVLKNKKILWVNSKKLNIKKKYKNNLKIYEFSTINKNYKIEILNKYILYEDNNTKIISGTVFKISY
jgi:hypothetical protein